MYKLIEKLSNNGYNWFIAERLNKDYYIFYYKIIIKYQKSIYYAFLGNSYFIIVLTHW